MATTMFTPGAIARRLGLQDARGPQGMFSRGANTYRGGFPNAHSGGGNPNLGRPSTNNISTGMNTPPPTMTALVGSLPPGAGAPDGTMNDSVLQLLRNKFMNTGGQGAISG